MPDAWVKVVVRPVSGGGKAVLVRPARHHFRRPGTSRFVRADSLLPGQSVLADAGADLQVFRVESARVYDGPPGPGKGG